MASSSASASSAIHQPKDKYDVFLSFRGADTRKTFTSHLLTALLGKKIETFIDYILESGDTIAPALLKAIEVSKISVIIFSENYAASGWCLDELVHILECKEKYRRHVIPIFYGILPCVVRYQTGSYKLEERFKDKGIDIERRLKWKGSLKKAADLSGFDSNATTVRDDADLIKQIVEDILKKLNYVGSSKLERFVGVERRIQQIESLLHIQQDDCVRIVGLWGMGGIGKTTLANALYHRLSSQFDSCCFLANVREASWADGKLSEGKLYDLRNKLLRKLLGKESINIDSPTIDSTTATQLSRRKVLVVLDDVNDLSQLEMLAGCDLPFRSGSRIIITTRDMQKLRQIKVGDNRDVEIYEVEKLNGDEADELLQLNAPIYISSAAADSTEVLRKVVDYAEGIPLALNTWRSLVHKGFWDDVKNSLNEGMEGVYRASYDVLTKNEKEIFLDIACFYKGMEINDAKRHLEFCRSSVEAGIKILIDMSLIALKNNELWWIKKKNNELWMHDVIQEMGREIVRKQCPEEPGRRNRLYTLEDIKHVLEKSTGTATIQTISIHLNVSRSSFPRIMNLTPVVFREMHNLRFLEVDLFCWAGKPILLLPQGLESLPEALRYVFWSSYPLKSLPSKFSPHLLVELCMPSSKLQTPWNKGQNPRNLKKIDLSYSMELVDVPNLSERLESICLKGCESLDQIPDLSKCLNIVSINLEDCKKLVEVPSYFENLHKLTYLNLRECPRLKSFPAVMPSNMEFLLLGGHQSILNSYQSEHRSECSELPLSIWSLEKLVELDLYGFHRIENLPNSTWRLYSLTSLEFSKMSIKGLPSSIECLSRVVSINLKFCRRLGSLPTSICKLKSLKELDLSGCSTFKSFPEISEPMECLEVLNLCETDITELPESIGTTLVGLKELNLSYCESLESVPDSIWELNLLEDFRLDGCLKLKKLPHSSSVILGSLISNLDLSACCCTSLEEIPDGLMICLTSLTSLILRNCERLQSLTGLPCLLRILDVDGCTNLRVVSFSMAAVTQGLDQKRDAENYSFRSCINLEKNAKNNIIDNAQLRIMRMATAYSKHKQINQEFKNRYLFDEYYSFGIVYPGNEIPPWFTYQAEGSSITIELPVHPSHTNTNFWQICLCAVLTIDEDEDRYIQEYIHVRCKSNFTTNNGDSSQFYSTTPEPPVDDDSQLMYFSWDQSLVFLWCLADWSTHVSNASEASFEFNRDDRDDDLVNDEELFYRHRIKVKRCGVCLLQSQVQDVVAVDQDVGEPQPEQVISRKRIRDEYEASGSATVTEF